MLARRRQLYPRSGNWEGNGSPGGIGRGGRTVDLLHVVGTRGTVHHLVSGERWQASRGKEGLSIPRAKLVSDPTESDFLSRTRRPFMVLRPTTWLLPGAFPSMLPGDGFVAHSMPVLLSGNSRRKPLLLGLRTRHRFAFSDAHTGRRSAAFAERRPPDFFRFRSRWWIHSRSDPRGPIPDRRTSRQGRHGRSVSSG